MNKLKDILYDKNDILIALLIVAIAAFIIYTRIDVIMDYPKSEADANTSSVQSEEPKNGSENVAANETDSDETDVDDKSSDDQNNEDPDSDSDRSDKKDKQDTPDKPSKDVTPSGNTVTFVVPAGSTLNSIANDLVNDGLIENKKEFMSYIVSQNLDTKVKAGTFKIPEGASMETIAEVLTK